MGIVEKIGQTVWTEIWPQTLFFTLVSVAITVGCETTGYSMKVNTGKLSSSARSAREKYHRERSVLTK